MLLIEALSALRAAMDDTGVFLTHTGNNPATKGNNSLPVNDLSVTQPGNYIVVGSGKGIEGHLIVAASGTTGTGTVTLATALLQDFPAYTPIGSALITDDDYLDALTKAVFQYSSFRPLMKRLNPLSIVAGTDTYTLPADFISPEVASFDAAVGLTSSVVDQGGVYALVYNLANRFTTTGYGSMGNFGSSGWYGYAPLLGDPADNPNGGGIDQGPVTYTFLNSAPQQLVIKPAPTANAAYDFFYNAVHVVPTATTATTVPVQDQYLPILYAKYLRCEAIATGKSQVLKYEINGEKIDHSKAPDYYQAQAASALAEFEKQVRFRPLGSQG